MAVFRLWIVIGLLWLIQFLFLPLFPLLRVVVDPLFLVLVFLGLHAFSGRFLWAAGFGLGLLKDLTVGGLFGASACSFALAGWMLGAMQHLVEKEDPFVQGVWAGILSVLQWFSYGFILTLADSSLGWSVSLWFYLPLAIACNVLCVFWGFPPLRRFLKIREKSRIHLYVSGR